MLEIKQLKKELGLSNKDLAECFNMSYNSYANSTAKERYENALLNFYKLAKKGWEKNKRKNLISDNKTIKQEPKPLIIHGVVSSLPSKEEMEIKLDYLIANKQESFKTKYDKLTFKFGFRTCFYWLSKKLNK